MLTRRKSSELKLNQRLLKDKGKDESNLKIYIKNKQTRKVLECRVIKYLFPIQQQCFETIYNGDDIIGQDRTGSGKIFAYCLPILERIRGLGIKQIKQKSLQNWLSKQLLNLILSQIKKMNDLKNQIDQVRKRCEIVVETPGRIQDLLERMVLKLDEIQVVVLDEADQMLNFGFQENIEKIMSYFNNDRKIQMLLYNATILNILIKRHETQTSTESKIMLYNVLKINQQLQQVIQFQFMVVVMLERLFFVRQKENAMKLLCILNYRLNHNLLHEDIPLQSVELVELERMEQVHLNQLHIL